MPNSIHTIVPYSVGLSSVTRKDIFSFLKEVPNFLVCFVVAHDMPHKTINIVCPSSLQNMVDSKGRFSTKASAAAVKPTNSRDQFAVCVAFAYRAILCVTCITRTVAYQQFSDMELREQSTSLTD